jgi:hypothetical protein
LINTELERLGFEIVNGRATRGEACKEAFTDLQSLII